MPRIAMKDSVDAIARGRARSKPKDDVSADRGLVLAASIVQALVLLISAALAVVAIASFFSATATARVARLDLFLGWQVLAVAAMVIHTPLRGLLEFRAERRSTEQLARERNRLTRGATRLAFERDVSLQLRAQRLHWLAGVVLTPLRWAGVYSLFDALTSGNLAEAVWRTKATLLLLATECLIREGAWHKKSLGEKSRLITLFAEFR